MHKLFCSLQIGAVALVTAFAFVWIFTPARFTSKFFAEPGISVEEYIHRLETGRSSWCRYNAAAALGELDDKSAIPALREALHDRDEAVRENAVQSLAELEATEAIPDIQRLKGDPSMDVRSNVNSALKELQYALKSPGKYYFYTWLLLPVVIITGALFTKLMFYPRCKSNLLIRMTAYAAWPVGVFLMWLVVQPYFSSEATQTLGFPFAGVVFRKEMGHWMEYTGPLTIPLMTMDLLYAICAPQVILAALIMAVFFFKMRRLNGAF